MAKFKAPKFILLTHFAYPQHSLAVKVDDISAISKNLEDKMTDESTQIMVSGKIFTVKESAWDIWSLIKEKEQS